MFEAYAVSVKLSLISNVSQGLLNITQHLAKSEGVLKSYQKRLDSIKLSLLGGGITAGAGLFGLSLIEKTLEPAREYSNQLALMNTLGMKQAEIAGVVGKAWETSSDVITTSATENLAAFRELRSAFGAGHESSALAVLPVVQRVKGILTALTGREQENVGFDMVKAIELRQAGGMSEAAVKRNADLMSRTLLGMGGTLTVNDFHQALKYGKMATMKWSDEFTYSLLPTLMQEMKSGHGGASTAGTSVYSLYQQVHGTMKKSAYPSWIAGGLIDPKDVVKNSTGNWQMKPGAVKDLDLFESNPYAWVQKDLAPAIGRIVTKMHVTEETAFNSLFSNRNAAFAAYTMFMKAKQFERDKALIEKADTSKEAYYKLVKENPMLAQIALQKKWNELLGVVGYEIMPDVIKGTLWLTKHLRELSGWMKQNHSLVKKLTYGFAGLSTALAIGGTVTLITGAFKGLSLALGFSSIGGVAGISTTALKLGALTKGLGAFGLMVFGVSDAISAITTGKSTSYDVVSSIGRKIGLFDKNDTAGTWAYNVMHGGYDTVKPGNRKPIQVTVVSKLNDREIARAVTEVQVREASRPYNGQTTFDMSMSPMPVGMKVQK